MARLLPEAIWKLAVARSTLPRFQAVEQQSRHAPARQAPSIANADNLSSQVQKLLTKILTMAMRANLHYDDTEIKAKRGCLTTLHLSRGQGHQPKIDRRAPARRTGVKTIRARRNLGEARGTEGVPRPIIRRQCQRRPGKASEHRRPLYNAR
ncbi:hypothetical protein E4U19_006112 [Claviceps sp. Clav32 group G5]|nr:hypothetical protein E4U19_006112 [Claviceps sp. Clav32 group G5]